MLLCLRIAAQGLSVPVKGFAGAVWRAKIAYEPRGALCVAFAVDVYPVVMLTITILPDTPNALTCVACRFPFI